MIGLNALPTRAEQILSTCNGDSAILLNPGNGEYYALDDVGSRIWQLCDGSRSVADMVSTIEAEYEAPRAQIELDVVELLDDLLRENLVKSTPTG